MQESNNGLRVEALKKQMPGFRLEASFEVGPNERVALVGQADWEKPRSSG